MGLVRRKMVWFYFFIYFIYFNKEEERGNNIGLHLFCINKLWDPCKENPKSKENLKNPFLLKP